MSIYTDMEIAYLKGQQLGRLATADSKGRPHVIPTGFHIDFDKGSVEIGAADLPGRGQKRVWLNYLEANPYAAFVVDDFLTEPSWTPRGVRVRGRAVIHAEGGERLGRGFGPIWVELIPERVTGWGIDAGAFAPPNSRKVA